MNSCQNFVSVSYRSKLQVHPVWWPPYWIFRLAVASYSNHYSTIRLHDPEIQDIRWNCVPRRHTIDDTLYLSYSVCEKNCVKLCISGFGAAISDFWKVLNFIGLCYFIAHPHLRNVAKAFLLIPSGSETAVKTSFWGSLLPPFTAYVVFFVQGTKVKQLRIGNAERCLL